MHLFWDRSHVHFQPDKDTKDAELTRGSPPRPFDGRPSRPPSVLLDVKRQTPTIELVKLLHVMIVLHTSSRCDVCLEPYTWNSTSDTPHAIPCGHIFCKTCLRTLAPSLCPLCRKTFVPERAKRLHVDRPPENTGAELELDFLQRLALVSGEHAPPENVEEVMTEVQTWLETQPSDSNKPLRCACSAIARHQTLKDKYIREKADHKEVKRKLRHNDHNAAHDRRTARAVEARLLSQLQEMENDYTAKIDKIEANLAALRAENARYRRTSNPLPPPPEPLPLERFPPFVMAAWDANPAAGSTSAPQQSKVYSNNTVPNGPYVPPDSIPYLNGYSRPSGNVNAVAASSSAKSDASRASELESGSEAEQHSKTFRFGSKRTHVYVPQRTASSPPPAPQPPPKQYPGATHRAYPYSRSQSDSDYRHRNGIIPGAAPAQRIIPPPPRWPDPTTSATHKPPPGSMRGWGEMIGNSQWGQVGEPSGGNAANATRGVAATPQSGAPPFSSTSTAAGEIPNHFAPAAAFVSGYASGLGSGYAFVNGYYPAYDDRMRTQDHPPTPPRLQEEGTGGLGLMNVPAPRQPGSVSPESTEPPSHRRNGTSSGVVGNVGTAATDTPQPSTPHPNGPRRYGVNRVQAGTERDSRSSWGTVETGEALRNSGVGMRGSMSDLGLIGLQGVAGTTRGPGSVTESLLTTPVRLGHENGFMGADPMPVREDDDDEDDDDDEEEEEEENDVSRRVDMSTTVDYRRLSQAGVGHYGSNPSQQRNGGGHSSDPRRQSREMDHHRRRSRQIDTMARQGSNPPSPTVREASVVRPSLSSSGGSGNALALDFNPSLSSLDLNAQSQSPPHSISQHSQITAPTPIVSRPNIMSTWNV